VTDIPMKQAQRKSWSGRLHTAIAR